MISYRHSDIRRAIARRLILGLLSLALPLTASSASAQTQVTITGNIAANDCVEGAGGKILRSAGAPCGAGGAGAPTDAPYYVTTANAGLSAEVVPSANVQTLLSAADFAAFRVSLGLAVGTNVQAFDADLSTWATLAPDTSMTDNRVIRANGAGGLTEDSAITVDDSGNLSGVGTIASGAITSSASIVAGPANIFAWSTRSRFSAPFDGVITLFNAASTDFVRLQFGGTTSSFPALRRTGAELDAVVGDASALTNINVLAEAYTNAGWDTDTGTPQKDAVRDVIVIGRSAFRAYLNSNQASYPDNAGTTDINFDTEVFDQGTKFASNTWTPEAGIVTLIACAQINGTYTAGLVSALWFYKNTATLVKGASDQSAITTFRSNCVSAVDIANGTDAYTVRAIADVSSGTGTIIAGSSITYFAGAVQ